MAKSKSASMRDKEFKKCILEQIAYPGLELWQEICAEYGVEIEIHSDAKGNCWAEPKSEYKARLLEFGSGIAEKKATFWYDKALGEWIDKFEVSIADEDLKSFANKKPEIK